MQGFRVTAPFASFRKPQAREYGETYRIPPPSTVIGMLLSYVGESDWEKHASAQVALVLETPPSEVSVYLRKMRTFGKKGWTPGVEYVEFMSNIRFTVWVREGASEKFGKPLHTRLLEAYEHPERISRFGALSLGLSDDGVEDFYPVETTSGYILRPNAKGRLNLPVRVGPPGASTRWSPMSWGRFDLCTLETDRPEATDFFTL